MGPRPPPRPPFQKRPSPSSDAIVLLGDGSAADEAPGGAAAGASQKEGPDLAQRQNGGPSIKINMSSSKAQDKKDASSNAKAMVSAINCY